MPDAELLALLVCPETHQDLTLASAGEMAILNEAIRSGTVRTTAGKEVVGVLEGALIRLDRALAYPIRDDIPVMLVPEALAIRDLPLNSNARA
jgi:uncharacterized protein YbaR (Trm112 family)